VIVTWIELVGMIALMLSVVTAIGAPAASFLPDDLQPPARWALAPAIGLAASICLLTSLNWWLPARTVLWVGLLPALLVALAVAWRRRDRLRVRASHLAVIVLLALVVAAGFTAPLAYQHAFGPGGYQVWDGPNYASLQTGLTYNAVTDDKFGPDWSLSVFNGEFLGPHNPLHQQIGYDSVAATVDAAAHLSPVKTQVAFMIALVVIGALGAYGAFLVLLPHHRWAALLAGALYAGPVVLQLVLDGSEGALAGISHILPMLALGLLALRPASGKAPAVLFAIVAASAAASYPVYFLALMGAAGLIWLVTIARQLYDGSGRPRGPRALSALRGLLLVAALIAVAAPFAFHRSLPYWKLLIKGGGEVGGLPTFDLPLPTLPGYVLGTREFYYLPHLSDVNVRQWIFADILPFLIVGLLVFAFVRIRALWPVGVLALVLLLESYGVSRSDCSYCLQRSLLPLGPLSGFALAAATVAIATSALPPRRLLATAIGTALLVVTWHTDGSLLRRGAIGAYFMPKAVHSVLDDADKHPGPVLIEGFMASFDAPGELPAALLAADGGGDRPGGPRLSVLVETNDYSGLAYLTAPHPSGPEFAPNYRTVITRLGTVRTQRRTVRRSGGLAVQERTRAFDVTAENGFVLNRALNLDQRAFIANPMTFVVTGPQRREVAVHVDVANLKRDQLGKLPRGSTVMRRGHGLSVCLPMRGQLGTIRRVVLPVSPNLLVLISRGPFANRPAIIGGPSLASMSVVSGCR
jgi:hypothetical protein